MKRLFKYMAPLLVVMMLGGTAWAYDQYDHVTQAPNNKGDVLIFPWYLAMDNGWQTKLTVVNTSVEKYTVAKLVIRSFKYSEELLDFFLYLSPSDVWTGVIRYDADQGAVVIYSTDDSALISTIPVTFASPEEPINQPMFPVECPGDADFLGYVEVIMAAVGEEYFGDYEAADVEDVCGKVIRYDAKPGMAKQNIYDEYRLFGANQYCYNMWYPDWNDAILAGWMDFQNPSLGLTSSLRATTLKEYENRKYIQITEETTLADGANNSMAEIEAALAKNDIALPYLNETDVTLHFFTFPTKLTDFSGCLKDPAVFSTNSEFFGYNMDSKGCIVYQITAFNLKEEYPKSGSPFSGGDSTVQKFCDEVNVLGSAAFPYAEGWARYLLVKSDGKTPVSTSGYSKRALIDEAVEPDFNYEGAPVLATYLNLGTTGLSLEYGAWTDGKVSSYETWKDYQYTENYGRQPG